MKQGGIKMELFPLDIRKEILLSDILSSIKSKIIHLDGMERLAAEMVKKDTSAIDKEIEKWNLYADVLRAVAYHDDEFNRQTLMYEQRGWESEWDVPIDLFNEAWKEIRAMIEEIHYFQLPKFKSNYEKQLKLLDEIHVFRNGNSMHD